MIVFSLLLNFIAACSAAALVWGMVEYALRRNTAIAGPCWTILAPLPALDEHLACTPTRTVSALGLGLGLILLSIVTGPGFFSLILMLVIAIGAWSLTPAMFLAPLSPGTFAVASVVVTITGIYVALSVSGGPLAMVVFIVVFGGFLLACRTAFGITDLQYLSQYPRGSQAEAVTSDKPAKKPQHLSLVDRWRENLLGEVAAQDACVGALIRICSTSQAPFFSSAPSNQPLCFAIAGPQGTGRSHIARTFAKFCVGKVPVELGELVVDDWFKLLAASKMEGRPEVLIIDRIDENKKACEYLAQIIRSGRTPTNDCWGRVLIFLVVPIDVTEDSSKIKDAISERLGCSLASTVHSVICHPIDLDGSIELGERIIRRLAADVGLDVQSISEDTIVAIHEAIPLGAPVTQGLLDGVQAVLGRQLQALSADDAKVVMVDGSKIIKVA